MKASFLKMLILAVILITAKTKVFASHDLGGEITYASVAPNVYVFTYKLYRDCTGASAGNGGIMLDIKPQGCAGGRSVTLSRSATSGIGSPYCSSIPAGCTTARANHEIVNYNGIITFTAQEQACSGGIIVSTTNGAWGNIANVIYVQSNLVVEAFINLKSGINNNSALINAMAPEIEFVCVNQETKLNVTAYDPDCDSLSYELVAPLSDPGVAYNYNYVNTGTANYIQNPNPPAPFCNTCTPPNPQLGAFMNVPAKYSPTFPMPSYSVNWLAINPATGTYNPIVPVYPYFNFNTANGEFSFKPGLYVPSPPVQGLNKYAVVVKINEWRKVNGVLTKVGYTRRDMLFIVEDCGTNENPSISGLIANGQQIQPGDIITVRPNAPLKLTFNTSDQVGDVLAISSNVTSILTGATFTQTSGNFPTGTINWVASATNATCGIRYFYIRVKDDFCPFPGKKTYVVGVRVSNSGTVTGLHEELKTDLNFKAYPNPFSEVVNFKFNSTKPAKELRIFNLLGQQVDIIKVSGNENDIRWEKAAGFAAGTYVAKLITTDNSVQTLKFSKLQ